jgi:hypothetical protein
MIHRERKPGMDFKRGDRVYHQAIGAGTVTSGKLGPNGELKVRPDQPHHSGRKIVQIMARRCVRLDEDERPIN